MRLQKASRYALYAASELARDPDRQMSAGEIAAIYGISLNHLAKVLRELGRAGLVEAARGVGGGYRFVANPKRTSLYDIIALFESPAGCAPAMREEGDMTPIGRSLGAVTQEIDQIAEATLRSISLATLLRDAG
ncbi:MAG: Rrf2 family transcriptional regulator [Rhodospirillales bacterium]